MKKQPEQQGSILVEAMIALIVMALGIAAIAKLQGEFTRGGSEAQARNVAMQLARQKMDDLKTYTQIKANGYAWNANVTWPATRPYELIQNNQGGGSLWGPSRRTTVGNTAYNISWRVSNFTWPTTNYYSIGRETGSFAQTDYKKVVMTVTWVNYPSTRVQRVDLTGNIAKLSDFGSKLVGGGTVSGGGPKVHYTPGIAPDVISIDTGGESIETTLPEPALKKIASADYYYSQFETITYGGGIALREEEFLNINCDCKFPSSSHTGLAYPVGRIIWHPDPSGSAQDKSDLTYYVNSFYHPPEDKHQFIAQKASGRGDFVGNKIFKVIGESAVGSSAQHPFCNICCRDHHDGHASGLASLNQPTTTGLSNNQVTGAYACNPGVSSENLVPGNTEGDRSRCADPWRPASDYDSTTGDHKHYTSAGVEVVPGGSGTYKESCRLKRVNGNFFVFQDWNLHGSTFIAAARNAFTPGAVNNILTQYRAYIYDYVSNVIHNSNNLPVTNITHPATHYVWPPLGVTPPTTTHFIARGIYMDYLDSFSLAKINYLITSPTNFLSHPNTLSPFPISFFENVAFNEINLTRLTDWQPQCVKGSNPGKGDVANNASGYVSDGPDAGSDPDVSSCVSDYGINLAGNVANINRGEVIYLNTSSFSLDATMLLSNTGIVGTNTPLDENWPSSIYPTANQRYYDTSYVRYTYNISGSGTSTTTSSTSTTSTSTTSSTAPTTTTTTTTLASCDVIVTGSIVKGSTSGAKDVTDNNVKIYSTPIGGQCAKSGSATSGTYTCNTIGIQPHGSSVVLSGSKVTITSGSSTVTVDCTSAVGGIVTLPGPGFTTTN